MSHLNPLFVLGTQRSGTTLITKVLSAHPLVYIQNELRLPEVFSGNRSKETILANLKKQTFINTGKKVEELVDVENQSAIWGLKDPQLTEYLNDLTQFSPDSKFIIVVRDPRGVVNSYIENKWGLGTNAYTGALRWKREVDAQLKFAKDNPENTVVIKYEDLVSNFEDVTRKICEFLHLKFDQSFLNYQSANTQIVKSRENLNVFSPPDIKIANKWQTKLSEHEISLIEMVSEEVMKEMSYDRQGKKITLSSFRRLYYLLHQKIIGEIQIQYRWRYAFWKSRKIKRLRASRYNAS